MRRKSAELKTVEDRLNKEGRFELVIPSVTFSQTVQGVVGLDALYSSLSNLETFLMGLKIHTKDEATSDKIEEFIESVSDVQALFANAEVHEDPDFEEIQKILKEHRK